MVVFLFLPLYPAMCHPSNITLILSYLYLSFFFFSLFLISPWPYQTRCHDEDVIVGIDNFLILCNHSNDILLSSNIAKGSNLFFSLDGLDQALMLILCSSGTSKFFFSFLFIFLDSFASITEVLFLDLCFFLFFGVLFDWDLSINSIQCI